MGWRLRQDERAACEPRPEKIQAIYIDLYYHELHLIPEFTTVATSMDKAELKPLIKQAQRNLKYDVPLETNDPMYVPLDDLRGSYSKDQLFFKLGILEDDDDLDPDQDRIFMLFGGHRGCGKSTLLRRYAEELHGVTRFYVVLVDVLNTLDVHNLRYSDLLLVQAKKLMQQLVDDDIALSPEYIQPLEDWFKQRVQTFLEHRQLDIGLETQVKAKGGIPFMIDFCAKLTSSIKSGTTYRDEVRVVVHDHFSEFARAFNILLAEAEAQLKAKQQGVRVLFIVDGTDRLRSEDATRFFMDDVHQLRQIQGDFIYCGPIVLMCEQGNAWQNFQLHRLPMIKLAEKGQQPKDDDTVILRLRELVEKRMDPRLFQHEKVLNYLICASGGHLRDLMRLLNESLAQAGINPIDLRAAENAVKQIASDYSRLVPQDAYPLMVEIDQKDKEFTPQSESSRNLLYNLVLLEYNSYWWQTHPAVQTLPAYQKALTAFTTKQNADSAAT